MHTEPSVSGDRLDPLRAYFDTLYDREDEPWAFSQRGVETLRHLRVAGLVRELQPGRILDLGCSLGQLTWRLASSKAEIVALDLSPAAAMRARAGGSPGVKRPHFLVGRATELPVPPASFDVVLAIDGLYSWQLSPEDRVRTLEEIHAALRPGGHAILTDHMRPRRFEEFVGIARASPLAVIRVLPLYDRPSYQFESLLKAVQHTRAARALRRSVGIARVLSMLGRLYGTAGSRHLCVVAKKA